MVVVVVGLVCIVLIGIFAAIIGIRRKKNQQQARVRKGINVNRLYSDDNYNEKNGNQNNKNNNNYNSNVNKNNSEKVNSDGSEIHLQMTQSDGNTGERGENNEEIAIVEKKTNNKKNNHGEDCNCSDTNSDDRVIKIGHFITPNGDDSINSENGKEELQEVATPNSQAEAHGKETNGLLEKLGEGASIVNINVNVDNDSNDSNDIGHDNEINEGVDLYYVDKIRKENDIMTPKEEKEKMFLNDLNNAAIASEDVLMDEIIDHIATKGDN